MTRVAPLRPRTWHAVVLAATAVVLLRRYPAGAPAAIGLASALLAASLLTWPGRAGHTALRAAVDVATAGLVALLMAGHAGPWWHVGPGRVIAGCAVLLVAAGLHAALGRPPTAAP